MRQDGDSDICDSLDPRIAAPWLLDLDGVVSRGVGKIRRRLLPGNYRGFDIPRSSTHWMCHRLLQNGRRMGSPLLFAMVPLVLIGLPRVLAAQLPTERPSCRVQLNRLNASPTSEAYRRTVSEGGLRYCGAEAAGALAAAIRTNAELLVSQGLLDRAIQEASTLRDQRLFETGLELARNAGNSPRVRTAGIRLA